MLQLMSHWTSQLAPPQGGEGTRAQTSRLSSSGQPVSVPEPSGTYQGDRPPPLTEGGGSPRSQESFRIHPSGDDFNEDDDTETPVYKRSKKAEGDTLPSANLTFPPVSASEQHPAGSSVADREEMEDVEKQLDLKFRAAIEALYALVPSLPPPIAEVNRTAVPMSVLASDLRKEDKTMYRYFPQSTLIRGCVRQVHEYWWDTPEDQADLSLPQNLPPNASWSKTLDARSPALAGFKDTFYKDPSATLSVDPPHP